MTSYSDSAMTVKTSISDNLKLVFNPTIRAKDDLVSPFNPEIGVELNPLSEGTMQTVYF